MRSSKSNRARGFGSRREKAIAATGSANISAPDPRTDSKAAWEWLEENQVDWMGNQEEAGKQAATLPQE